ncbi:MAG TPA: DUF3795 domain-containing protein [Spirochaetia bacterium]|nr:DUF3795 domain-containing protein [Spirochaetia bacterium]
MNFEELTAPCGIDCFNCEVYESNITPEVAARLSAAFGFSPEKAACPGCRASGGCRLHWGNCDTLDCVKSRGVSFCYECADFPCPRLLPCAEAADRYPHNLKVFNLSRIRNVGIDVWARESMGNRALYFKGKFAVGKGPQKREP